MDDTPEVVQGIFFLKLRSSSFQELPSVIEARVFRSFSASAKLELSGASERQRQRKN